MANRVEICGIDTNKLPKLKAKELDELMKKVKQGDELAKEEFVVANLRLVLSIVQRFVVQNDKIDDMFQVGCVGLIKAIDNFDITLGLKFSTYAVPMIIGEIKRFLRDNNAIRVSRSLRDVAYKALQIKEEISKKEHREASLDEVANIIGVTSARLSFCLDAISETVSLSDPILNDGSDSISVLDQISDEKCTPETCIDNIALKDAFFKLDDREKEILNLRYYVGKTQTEVSDEVGISQAQVSRLEKNALQILRKNIT